MPGFMLHEGAVVICMHGGQAEPIVPSPRVLVAGQPAVTQVSPYVIAGCPFVPPAPGPCVTAQFVVAATRVFAEGMPVLLQDSQAVCVPTGTGLLPLVVQPRVRGT